MSKMRLFIDTHDKAHGTFPEGLTEAQFQQFFVAFEAACAAENVRIVTSCVGIAEGRAFCTTMAESADAVKRAHERVGLAFDSITEVRVASPDTILALRDAA